MSAAGETPDEETRRLVGGVDVSLATLAAAVDGLTAHQADQLRRTRTALKWTIAGLVLDLVLTALGGGLYARVQDNTDQLKAVNARVSSQALCPLYEVFLRSYNPQGPAAQQDPAEYKHNFDVIEAGARALGCARVTRGR